MLFDRSYRFNLVVVAFLLIGAACFCRLNCAKPADPQAIGRFERGLHCVLKDLGASHEVSFALVAPFYSPGSLRLVYSMERWPLPQQASVLYQVSQFVAQHHPRVNLQEVSIVNSDSQETLVLPIRVTPSDLSMSLRCEEIDLSERLRQKAQGQLDQMLGSGTALALVDCELSEHRTAGSADPIKVIRASIFLEPDRSWDANDFLYDDREADAVEKFMKGALGIDEARGDQLGVARLPDPFTPPPRSCDFPDFGTFGRLSFSWRSAGKSRL